MFRPLGAALVAAALFAAPANAGFVTYSDNAAWTAATQSPTGYDFGAFAGIEYTGLEGYLAGPFSFTGPNLSVYDDNSYGPSPYLEADSAISVIIDGNVRALSFNIGTWSAAGLVTVTVNGQDAGTFGTLGNPSQSFFGITADEAITSVLFSAVRVGGGGEFPPALFNIEECEGEGCEFPPFPPVSSILFDIVSFQTALLADEQPADVPEPAMLGLFGLGALGLGLSRRRRA